MELISPRLKKKKKRLKFMLVQKYKIVDLVTFNIFGRFELNISFQRFLPNKWICVLAQSHYLIWVWPPTYRLLVFSMPHHITRIEFAILRFNLAEKMVAWYDLRLIPCLNYFNYLINSRLIWFKWEYRHSFDDVTKMT